MFNYLTTLFTVLGLVAMFIWLWPWSAVGVAGIIIGVVVTVHVAVRS